MTGIGARGRRVAAAVAVVAGLVVGLPDRTAAQQADDQALRQRMEALETGQRAMQKQLEAIQKQLQEISGLLREPAPQGEPPLPAELTIEGAALKGQPTAKLTIVEFSDFQCPFCGRYARETLGQIERDYIETGKVRYAFRNFPIESIHPQAFGASEAAECAGAQSKYWELHDRIFANQQAMAREDLVRHAQAVGLEMAKFQRCLDNGEMAAKVRQDFSDAIEAGVNSTPAFLIGLTQPGGKVKVLRRIGGAQPYANFKAALDGLLASPGAQQ